MVKPNKYLEIWPQIVENSIKYLEGKSSEAERRFAFPAAFITVLYVKNNEIKLREIANFIEKEFNFLEKTTDSITIVSERKYASYIQEILYHSLSIDYFCTKEGRQIINRKEGSRRASLNEIGIDLIEGNLEDPNKIKSEEFNISLTPKYEELPNSNIEEIKRAINMLYGSTENLKYSPIPKAKMSYWA